MASRWNRRRLLVTLLLMTVAGVFYLQQRDPYDGVPPWKMPPGVVPPGAPQQPEAAQPEKPAPPAQPARPAEPEKPAQPAKPAQPVQPEEPVADAKYNWLDYKFHHPIPAKYIKDIPQPSAQQLRNIPKIQYKFEAETTEETRVRLERLAMVQSNFTHAWKGYKTQAWMSDEVRPLTGGGVDRFGGWAATLVDSLDTLWIMGLRDEFEEAVKAVDQIDFSTTTSTEVNVFETTIRYLGGFLAAYDLSGGAYPSLLRKATELGDMLYAAFDTPNHLPISRWKAMEAQQGIRQKQAKATLVSEPGSLTLEFTRLSQLTGNPKYYDAVQRVMDLFARQQQETYLPGMWPVLVNLEKGDLTGGSGFTIGGMADSLYEYLPKQYLMLGGAVTQYRSMYVQALDAMKTHIFFRGIVESDRAMLFPGEKTVVGRGSDISQLHIEPKVQHLGCFAGGMVGLGARLFEQPGDLEIARQLVEGCIWGYENSVNGIMPEIVHVAMCPPGDEYCEWSKEDWYKEVKLWTKIRTPTESFSDFLVALEKTRLVPGVTRYDDKRYILRPEAIESVFILYRMTGDRTLLDRAWGMFEAIVRNTKTDIAHAALSDCTLPNARDSMVDSMESFWLAETLKYFYLLYAEPDLVSLDDYVLNTEAHPLKRPTLLDLDAATSGGEK